MHDEQGTTNCEIVAKRLDIDTFVYVLSSSDSMFNRQDFEKFKADMLAKNPGINPQVMVNKMVTSGQVSQQSFEKARQMAAKLGIKI